MALIEKRRLANGKQAYRARVKYRGRTLTSTHHSRDSAERWAAEVSLQIRDDTHFAGESNRRRPLGELIERYKAHVLPLKRNGSNQRIHLDWWLKRLGNKPVAGITRAVIAQCRDELLAPNGTGKKRGPATVVRYLAALSHVFTVAISDWEWASTNPVRGIRKPKEPRGRERYLEADELNRLLKACQASSSAHLYSIVILALSTGMRRGEIVGLRWNMIDFKNGFIRLKLTKNGSSRSVPLVNRAYDELAKKHKVRRIDTDLVFPPQAGSGMYDINKAWTTARNKAKLNDFRFHDLRHTAASYLAMNGASTVQIATILGHKTLAMVKRYAHLSETHTAAVVGSMNASLFGNITQERAHG